jgi:hypothetical protein
MIRRRVRWAAGRVVAASYKYLKMKAAEGIKLILFGSGVNDSVN